MGNTYRVPRYTLIQAASTAKLLGMSQLYGVGIRRAVVLEQRGKNNDRNNYTNVTSSGYSPDAQPNANGGYTATDRWDGYMASSLSGLPVMCWLKFVGGTYVDLNGNTVVIPDVTLETVVLTVTQHKNIKKTRITGRNIGSVKEHIGMDDFDVEIRAILTADAPVNESVQKMPQDGVYPRENMSELWRVLSAPISIPIECWYLQMFGIENLVIDDSPTFQQIEGEYSMQRIVIPCVSDYPLIIKQVS
jgi:hypothetical protein